MALPSVRSVQEFHESDKDQGVERTYLYYKNSSTHLYTEKQEVDLVESPSWGRMLFLDGVLQSTTKDEIIYHTVLVHPLMSSLKSLKSILILGGGEGATAREVLRWPVDSVTMVDYDEELVKHMKIHAPEWSEGAFCDSRLEVIYGDAWYHLQLGNHYDAVIIDLTDPELKIQRWRVLLRMVFESVRRSNGSFVMNAGLYLPWKTDTLRTIKNMIVNLCLEFTDFTYKIYTTFVPSFNGEWTFILVHRKVLEEIDFNKLSMIPAWIRRSIKALENDLIDNEAHTKPSVSKISVNT